jgi:hypothetical protein
MEKLATLLTTSDLTDGQELNLKLLLQSVDDPVVMANFLAFSFVSDGGDGFIQNKEVETKAFVVLKTLVVRTFQHNVR